MSCSSFATSSDGVTAIHTFIFGCAVQISDALSDVELGFYRLRSSFPDICLLEGERTSRGTP